MFLHGNLCEQISVVNARIQVCGNFLLNLFKIRGFFWIMHIYRPHPKDGEGNVFTLSTPGGGGQVSPAGGGGQVSPARGGSGQSSRRGGSGQSSRGGGQVSPAGRGEGSVQLAGGGSGQSSQQGGSVQPGGGVSILRPLAGGMPLAFTQEDFLVNCNGFRLAMKIFVQCAATSAHCVERAYQRSRCFILINLRQSRNSFHTKKLYN